jgi:D-alanyl-D-alanine carboxypeptidase/D-alanyl-D-alanine-endopeptidase (penicillin-binding protein 4)
LSAAVAFPGLFLNTMLIHHALLRAGLCVVLTLIQSVALARNPVRQDQDETKPRQEQASQAETLDSLRGRIAAHLSQPRFGAAAWGVKVVSLDTGKTVFDHNADKYFSPASNAKLYSTALALDRLGPDYRIKTSLYATVRPDASGVVKGDLIVYGRGDPTMAARLNDGDYYRALEPLAEKLATSGVRRIEGDLIGDESFFSGPPLGAGWEWDDLQWYYGAEVSALTVNDNSVDLFVKPAERAGIPCAITTGPSTAHVILMNRTQTVARGVEGRISVYRPLGENVVYVSGRLAVGDRGYSGSVAVHNPAGLFVTLFKEVLARRGIEVKGRVRTVDWKYREVTPVDFTKVIELGWVESAPVKDIVRETLKPSQNLYAQLLLLQVGAMIGRSEGQTTGHGEGTSESSRSNLQSATPASAATSQDSTPDFSTTEEIGIKALNVFMAEAGIKKGAVLLEEGSGLSRKDIITPNATVELLKFMGRHRSADIYRDALPIAGVDGTLERRMKATPAENNVRAKTGSLRYVYALSGYVTTGAGERLAFAIMVNNASNPDRAVSSRDDIDAIPIMLARFTGRT